MRSRTSRMSSCCSALQTVVWGGRSLSLCSDSTAWLCCEPQQPADPDLLVLPTAGGVYTLYSDSPDYDKARRTFSKFSDNWPTAVAYPASTAQVQTAVKCARKADLKVHPRCGNHANEGVSRGLVIAVGCLHVSNMHLNCFAR